MYCYWTYPPLWINEIGWIYDVIIDHLQGFFTTPLWRNRFTTILLVLEAWCTNVTKWEPFFGEWRTKYPSDPTFLSPAQLVGGRGYGVASNARPYVCISVAGADLGNPWCLLSYCTHKPLRCALWGVMTLDLLSNLYLCAKMSTWSN